MLVIELKQEVMETFDNEILEMIPNNCPTCGLPLIINPTFTGCKCVNMKCVSKVSNRCVAMLTALGFLGLGEAAMLKFCKDYQITCPIQLYLLEEQDLEMEKESAYKRDLTALIQFLKQHNQLKLSEYLALANIPGIQLTTAEKLVSGFDDLALFYRTLDVDGIEFIRNQLGINTEVSLMSIKVFENLYLFKDELLSVLDHGFVTLIEVPKGVEPLELVISDSPGVQWKKKKDFENEVTELFKDKFDITFKKAVTKKTDILINAGEAYTNKVEKAERYGIPILDGQTFISIAEAASNKEVLKNTIQ